MLNKSIGSNLIGTKPFNPFIILSSYDQSLLFFTQTFSQISGFHPSTIPCNIPVTVLDRLKPDIRSYNLHGKYEIYQFKEKPSYDYKDHCVDALIHELRTASLIIDLGANVLAKNEQLAPVLLQKILRAAHRQKISTLIASDFIHLVTSTPIIYPTSLLKILTDGLSRSPGISHVKFRLASSIEAVILTHVNPTIWGNFHHLTNFFTTLLTWLGNESVEIEMEIINPVSVQASIKIPHNRFLSNIQGFPLISHYLHYITAYFNGRSYITQNSIKILFSLSLSGHDGLSSNEKTSQ